MLRDYNFSVRKRVMVLAEEKLMVRRLPIKVDLSTFGIHISNTGKKCCRCGADMTRKSEAIFADELCWDCESLPRGGTRRIGEFYTANSVHVLPPSVRASRTVEVVQGVRLPQKASTHYACVVKIDGVLYVGQAASQTYVRLLKDGQVVHKFGLQIAQRTLEYIHRDQQRARG